MMSGAKGDVKGVSKTGRKVDGVRANVSKPDPGCSYVKGWCKKYGGGAKKHWRPKWVRVKGVDGKYSMKMTHQTYYVCDLSLEAGTRLRQTRLSLTDSGRAETGTGRGPWTVLMKGTRIFLQVQRGRAAAGLVKGAVWTSDVSAVQYMYTPMTVSRV